MKRDIASALNIDYALFRQEWEALHADRYLGKLSGTIQVFKQILQNLDINRDENLSG